MDASAQPLTARELYQALHRRFDDALARLAGGPALVPALLGLAFEQLELASEPDPSAPLPPSAPACAPGCASIARALARCEEADQRLTLPTRRLG